MRRWLLIAVAAMIAVSAYAQPTIKIRLQDDQAISFGDSGDFVQGYDLANTRLELTDPSDNILGYWSDLGTTGMLGVTGRIEVPQIGIAADTDLLTLTSGALTVAGSVVSASGLVAAGADDTTRGQIIAYGAADGTCAILELYNGATVDTQTGRWRFGGFYNTGDFFIGSAGGSLGTVNALTIDETTLEVSIVNDLDVTGSLKLATVSVTSTAAELNILDGVTSTAAELNILDGVTSTAAELNILDGVTATATEINHLDNCDRLEKVIKVALTASDADAGVFAWQNTEESSDVIVTRVIIDVTTAASAACEINIGQAATATASDNLIDGIDVNTATGVFDNIDDQGTNGNSKVRVTDDHYVTGTVSSGASSGLVGNVYIYYVVI